MPRYDRVYTWEYRANQCGTAETEAIIRWEVCRQGSTTIISRLINTHWDCQVSSLQYTRSTKTLNHSLSVGFLIWNPVFMIPLLCWPPREGHSMYLSNMLCLIGTKVPHMEREIENYGQAFLASSSVVHRIWKKKVKLRRILADPWTIQGYMICQWSATQLM